MPKAPSTPPPPPGSGTHSASKRSSIERVAQAAETLGLATEIRTMPDSTRTAEDAAAAVGSTVGEIVKSLVFASGEELVLLLVSGAHQADLDHVAAAIGRPLERCDARRVRDVTGFAIGGVAPIGHLSALPVYMDEALLAYRAVWCAAGRPDSVFSVDPRALMTATGARVVSVRP